MKKVLTWDYETYEAICKASGTHKMNVRRNIMRLAELLGVEFEGIRGH